MKRIFTTRLGMLVAMLLTILPISAYDFEVDGIYYDVISLQDLTCKVVKGDNKYKGDVVIPSEVVYNSKTLTVTEIEINAFGDCSSLTSVVIPDSVTEIGGSAFYRCSSLTSVVIGDSVTEIGRSAFWKCSSLTSVVIPDSVTGIGDDAFRECSSLTSVVIGDSVTEIGEGAFDRCSSLTSVVIGDSVTEIGLRAFRECSSLTSVVIPDSVTEIGRSAFYGCSSLEEIRLSDSLAILNYGLFSNCVALQSITIPGSVESMKLYDSGIESFIFNNCSNLRIMRFEYGKEILQMDKYTVSGYLLFKTLELEKIFIDRELSNSLDLPYLKELILGEHVAKVQIIPSKSESLETIECYAVEPPVCREFTNAQYMNVVVKVPNVSLEKYQQTDGWKNFWNLEGFDAPDSFVEDINSDKTVYEIGRYDINGNTVNANYKGVMIIRYSDGSTKKILNK